MASTAAPSITLSSAVSSPTYDGRTISHDPLAQPSQTAFEKLSPELVEKWFEFFRDDMLNSFPLMHLPPQLTAQQLSQDRPFLLRSILSVASRCDNHRQELGQELMAELGQKMLVKNEGDVDMLLGILVYSTWSVLLRDRTPCLLY
jgi:hypothetical protein